MIPIWVKKMAFDWFGKARYSKGLKDFDEETINSFEKYSAKKAPFNDFLTVENLYKALMEDKLPDEAITEMVNTYNSEGWKYIRSYIRMLQRGIEKRLVHSDLTDREFFTRRVEYVVYEKILAYEMEVKNKFIIIQENKAQSELNKK